MKKNLIWVALMFAVSAGCARRTAEPAPDELVALGWHQFRMGEYRQAVDAFESAIDSLPTTDPRQAMALYGLATTWDLRMPLSDQDKDQAGELYRRVIKTAPQSRTAPWSCLALARMEHLVPVGQEPDMPRVRAAYEAVIARYPASPAADEALLHLQATHLAEMTPEAAAGVAEALETFVSKKPNSGHVSAAYGLLASCYELLKQPERQLASLIRGLETREIDPANPVFEKSWIYWQIACVAEFEVGDFETARDYYQRLLDEYPKDVRGFGAESALKRMNELEARLREGEAPAEGRAT